jgi:hypothetical protein
MHVPWLRWLVAGLSLLRPGFASGSVHVGSVVDKVALGQVFLRVIRFSPVNITPLWLNMNRSNNKLNRALNLNIFPCQGRVLKGHIVYYTKCKKICMCVLHQCCSCLKDFTFLNALLTMKVENSLTCLVGTRVHVSVMEWEVPVKTLIRDKVSGAPRHSPSATCPSAANGILRLLDMFSKSIVSFEDNFCLRGLV